MPPASNEVFFSVDIETDGPIPGEYSMLSLGACVIGESPNPRHFRDIYLELQPIRVQEYDREAYAVAARGGLDRWQLMVHGKNPTEAMQEFATWIELHSNNPVFVGLNAAFDWQFVNWYFLKFTTKNPFGFKPLDICAYAMGKLGLTTLKETGDTNLRKLLGLPPPTNAHHALEDAKEQAELFSKLHKS